MSEPKQPSKPTPPPVPPPVVKPPSSGPRPGYSVEKMVRNEQHGPTIRGLPKEGSRPGE